MIAGTSDAGRWRCERLLHAPHRLAFFAATLMLALSAAWWAAAQLAATLGLVLPWSMPPALAHSVLMSFGFMPLFFVGFLFTAGPKWLGQPAVEAHTLLQPLLAMLAGWLAFLLAVHGREPAFGQTVGTFGLCAVLWGWAGISARFVALLRTSPVHDRIHATLAAVACGVGALALAAVAFGLAEGDFALMRAATQGALWGFVGLVFASVAHRMIPFFSASALPSLDAWRPLWLLAVFVGVFAFEALCAAAHALFAPQAWLAPLAGLQAAVELAAGAGLIALAVRWGLVQSLRVRMLAMLHVGFTWLGIALGLSGIDHAAAAAGHPQLLGLAPLHAYTMGFLGSTMFAMVTRVSTGHGGRTLAADNLVWRLFWVLQITIVARLCAALVPSGTLTAVAASGWAGVCLAWSARYGRWFGTPRADGRPG